MALSDAKVSVAAPGATESALRIFCALRRHVWFKSMGTAAFMLVFFRAYFYLLRDPAGPVTTMPLTALDRWIGFQPWALPIYLSLWVYVSLPVALMSSRREIVGYGLRVGALCLAGLGVFYVWPTKVPPVILDWALYPDFSILRGIDAAGNACPSLHVATAVFTGCWLNWMAPALGFGTRLRFVNWLWCAAIVYSTMATKQHVAIDALAGTLLGASVAWVFRPRAFCRFAGAGDDAARP